MNIHRPASCSNEMNFFIHVTVLGQHVRFKYALKVCAQLNQANPNTYKTKWKKKFVEAKIQYNLTLKDY